MPDLGRRLTARSDHDDFLVFGLDGNPLSASC
jgi:hypothetical protein